MGLIILDGQIIVLGAVIVTIIDAILLFIAVKAFQRETILTKWK
jgi:hypothetical protein